MVERNLGEVTLTTTGVTPTTSANPSHTASTAAPKGRGSAQPPAVEANKDGVDISTAEPSTAAAAAVAAMLETAVESVAQGLEGGNRQGLLAGDTAAGDEKGKHEIQTPQNNVPPATIFRCGTKGRSTGCWRSFPNKQSLPFMCSTPRSAGNRPRVGMKTTSYLL